MTEIVKTWTPTARQAALLNSKADTIFFGGARGGGKAQPLSCMICTPFGQRPMWTIKVGCLVSGADGNMQKVIGVYPQGEQDVYEVSFSDGSKTRCTLDHIWNIKQSGFKSRKTDVEIDEKNKRKDDWRIWTFGMIKEYLDEARKNKTSKNLMIPMAKPVKFTKACKPGTREIDPYVLGALLGNGKLMSRTRITFSSKNDDVLEEFLKCCDSMNICRKVYAVNDYRKMARQLDAIGLMGIFEEQKFIPEIYKNASLKNRISLVQGILDSKALVNPNGHVKVIFFSEKLALDLQWVIRSIGGNATMVKHVESHTGVNNKKVDTKWEYRLYISMPDNSLLFRSKSKKVLARKSFNGGKCELSKRIVGYRYVGKEQCQCIQVSNADCLYLTDDFIVTHNTFGEGLFVLDRAVRYGKSLDAIFFRRTNPELEDAIKQFDEIFSGVAEYKISSKTFCFWNGAELKMRFLDEMKDVKKYQGHNYGLMLFDEVTNFDNFNWIEQMRGSLRSSKIPTQLILSGNPGGPLHNRLKSEFINPYPTGNVLIPDGYSEELKRYTYKEFIPSKVTDNPYLLNTGYIANLKKTGTPEQVRQWLEGDWNVTNNAAFSDLFNPFIHIVRPFRIPYTWKISKSYDYGSSKPWACVWFAVSDGSDYIAADGELRSTIPGDIFCVYELYGSEIDSVTRKGCNIGTKESIQSQATKIKLVEETTFANCRIVQSIADSAIFKKESGAYCVAEDFENDGVYWERCHKYPGSRKQEYILMRERMIASCERDDKPGIFWFSRCQNSIRTIPELQLDTDEEAVATGGNSEDHLYDAHSYFLLSQNIGDVQSGSTMNY